MAILEMDESGSGETFVWDDADEIVCDGYLTASTLSGKGSMGAAMSLFWIPCVEAIGSSTPSIAFNVHDSAEKHDNSLSLAEDLTPEGTDNIGGMEMQVQKYELYGMDDLEYYCEKDGKIISVCFKDIDPFTNYAAGAILSSLSFQ